MKRKEFLKKVPAATILLTTGLTEGNPSVFAKPNSGNIYTTTGPINSGKMGVTLVHEHIMSIFGGPAKEPAEYDNQRLLKEVLPYLNYIKSLGCKTIVDCSAAYLGRNASLLKKISQETDIQILTNTGIYGAAADKYIPDYAYKESPEQLAGRWIDEFNNGIQGTGIKPGFVKTGVDKGKLSDIDAKLVRAAALTHLETGLLLQIHTSGNTEAAVEQLEILKKEGVSPEAWVWVHAQNVDQPKPLIKAANEGAWISLDGLRTPNYLNDYKDGSSTLMNHFNKVYALKKENLLSHVLLSHDGATYPFEDTPKRPFDVLFKSFIPMLKAAGFTEAEINQLIINNPASAFTQNIRTI